MTAGRKEEKGGREEGRTSGWKEGKDGERGASIVIGRSASLCGTRAKALGLPGRSFLPCHVQEPVHLPAGFAPASCLVLDLSMAAPAAPGIYDPVSEIRTQLCSSFTEAPQAADIWDSVASRPGQF